MLAIDEDVTIAGWHHGAIGWRVPHSGVIAVEVAEGVAGGIGGKTSQRPELGTTAPDPEPSTNAPVAARIGAAPETVAPEGWSACCPS